MKIIMQSKTGQILAVLVLVFIVTMFLELILTHIKTKNNRVNTAITLIKSLAKYVGALIALIWILSIIGVNAEAIFAGVGIVALVVGFSAESLIADLITGTFMLFENQFNVDDMVEINGYRGTVKEVGIRTISIIDTGNNVKIVNNSKINSLVNLSKVNSKAVCDIQISYNDDLEEVEKVLSEVLTTIKENHSGIFLTTPMYLGVQDLKEKGMMLRIVSDVEEKDYYNCRRILNREILLGLKEKGINIFK